MKKFLISVNGTQYEVDVEEVTGSASPSAIPQTAAPKAVPAAAPAPAQPQAAQPMPATAGAPAPAPAPVTATTKAAAAAAAPGSQIVNSPMPGTILKVSVAVGESVKKNQVLCVLEAMKMENDIVSPRDAEVAGIMVTRGASVNAGDALISLK